MTATVESLHLHLMNRDEAFIGLLELRQFIIVFQYLARISKIKNDKSLHIP